MTKKSFTLLIMMMMMVVQSFALSFTDVCKLNNKLYAVGPLPEGVSYAILTNTEYRAISVNLGKNFYCLDSGNGYWFYQQGTSRQSLGTTTQPASGDFVYEITSNAGMINLYDSIAAAKQTLPDLALDKHAALGSAGVDAANASNDAKAAVGDITNNHPYLNLQQALQAAEEIFETPDAKSSVYQEASTTLETARKNNASFFQSLEVLRDSLVLLKDSSVYEVNGRKLIEYPCGQDIFNGTWDSAMNDYQNGDTYSSATSSITMAYTCIRTLMDNTKNYTAEDLAFFDKMSDPSYTPEEAVAENDYPVIPNISVIEYGLFVKVPTTQIAEASIAFGKEVAAWAGSAPFPSWSGIALAGAQFAVKMTFAGMLMASNIKHMQTLQKCIDWLNKDCQDDYAYAFLSEEVSRSRMNLRSTDNSAIADLQHDILKNALERAKELSSLGVQKLVLRSLIYDAQDIYYDMNKVRNNKYKTPSQAKPNLRQALTEAETEMNKEYVVKTVTYTYDAEGQYSLYDFAWYSGSKKFADNETPTNIITREIAKLQNAMDLYSKQYELEQKLDEVIAYMEENELYAAPQKTINDKWQEGELFNLDVTALQKTIAEIDDMITALDNAITQSTNEQKTITDAIEEAEEVIDNLLNNGPKDELEAALAAAIKKFGEHSDMVDVLKDIIDLQAKEDYDQNTFDDPDFYSDYMINTANAWFDANKNNMTPTQIEAFDKAMAAACIALAEYRDPRYQNENELKRKYIVNRMYFSALALEYAMKMTILPAPIPAEDLEKTLKQQLEEAIMLVSISACSQYEGDMDDLLKLLTEANDLYRDKNAAVSDKMEMAERLYSMLGIDRDVTTAINGVNSNEVLRDGKFVENGTIVIVKNGKKFRANGTAF